MQIIPTFFIFRANFDCDAFTHAHVAIEHAHVPAAQVHVATLRVFSIWWHKST